MPKYEVLNIESHKNISILTNFCKEHGDQVSSIVTFPTEFGNIQSEYPILFRKDAETGEFGSFAMLGFQANENLFLTDKGWNGDYVPAALAKGPFVIGFQNQESIGKSAREPVINIDLEDPRVVESEGEALFNKQDKLTPYVENITTILSNIHHGLDFSKQMFSVFLEYDLIEPVTIDVEFNNGEKVKVQGCYTIHEEKLKALNAEALDKLNRSGFLQAAYMVIASLYNIKKLINLKNARNQ